MARRIDAGPWIAVLVPRAAYRCVLLDDEIGDACIFQPNCRTKSGDAGSDNQHAKIIGNAEAIPALQREGLVLAQSRGNNRTITGGYLFSGVDLHHVGEYLVRKRNRRRHGAASPPEDRAAGGRDYLGADVFAEAAGAVVGKSFHAPA